MQLLIIAAFAIGYFFIIIEHKIKLDKAASALIMGVITWVILALGNQNAIDMNHELADHISEIAGIAFFLIGAMTIVEIIDLHDGFQVIINLIKTQNKRILLIIMSVLAFFLSAVLDNLTTAIVMSTLAKKILKEKKDIYITIGMIIIAANAGGAWSPIGDVTTTMLWIGNQITASEIIKRIFIPSLISMLIPLGLLMFRLKGNFEYTSEKTNLPNKKERNIIFISGLLLLISVPIFKTITHLPPFMGMLFAVGIIWAINEIVLKKSENKSPIIFKALERIDLPSILFFVGIF